MHNLLEIYPSGCIISLLSRTRKVTVVYGTMPGIKRIYDAASSDDGYRILVDRLWPRGFTKRRAKVDLWLKDVAPSEALRKWFAHDPAKWVEFMRRYFKELENANESVSLITSKIKEGRVTLLYGAKDKEMNNAVVLQEFIKAKLRR